MIIKNHYPIPLIIEIMNRIKDAKRFIKLDIHDIFNHIYIMEENEYKTIFHTRYDHFEYLIMLFDLCNIFTIFQSYINDALHEFLDEFCIIYLDNILIYIDDSLEDHINYIYQILQYLLDNDLFVKFEKCEFHIQEIKFLGFIISLDDIVMNPNRIIIIVD